MERIFVIVRVRPLDAQDAKGIPWKISGNSISLPNQAHKFEFDRVLGEVAKNIDVYEARTKDIVAAAIAGFNGTVFAYGQTSSGKTHTMRGSQEERGVIPLAVQDIFKTIQEEEDREFLLRMSYMEIYNEEINDLLVPEHRKLQIHESIERGIFIAGLREEIVASPEQVFQLMEFGESHRHFGETNMNVYSSRSHTIFRMVIESRVRDEDAAADISCDAVRVSVLNLVDLAGSERVAKTGAKGERLKEGSHINKSLLTLGTVINKLSEGTEAQRGHVPYRDSKLTRILQPSLGGNAKTAIICNITPSLIHVDETKGTLQFASRALRVTNCAQVNEVMTDAALLKRQKKEIEELRAKLQESHSEDLEEEVLNLRNTLLQSELEKERIALELQEEKRAQAERERQYTLKINNLSSMVLYSALDERDKPTKKFNRRETWCPTGHQKNSSEEDYDIQSRIEVYEVMPLRREMSLPPPFHELCEPQDSDMHNTSEELKNCRVDTIYRSDDNVPPSMERSVSQKDFPIREQMPTNELWNKLTELQLKYQDLEHKHENEIKLKDAEIEDLAKQLRLAEAATGEDHALINFRFPQSIDTSQKELSDFHLETNMCSIQCEEQVELPKQEKVVMQDEVKFPKTKNNDAEHGVEQVNDSILERTIADMKEKLKTTESELAVAHATRGSLSTELETVSLKMNAMAVEFKALEEKYTELATRYNHSENTCRQLEVSLRTASKEKEELGMQISEAILEMEEQKAMLVAKEKAGRKQWENSLKMAEEKLHFLNLELEKKQRKLESEIEGRKSSLSEIACLRDKLEHSEVEFQASMNALNDNIKNLQSKCELLSLERDEMSMKLMACKMDMEKAYLERNEAHHDIEELKSKLEVTTAEKLALLSHQSSLKKRNEKMVHELSLAQILEEQLKRKVESLEEELKKERLNFIKETSRLQFRLSVTQEKLDASRGRHLETFEEKEVMRRNFEEASRKLNEEIVAGKIECFELKKKLYNVELCEVCRNQLT